MDQTYIEEAERLGKYRIALYVLAGLLLLAGAVPWIQDLRTQRRQQWFEQLAWDRYRLNVGGKAMVRTHLESELPREQAQAEIERMRLDKEPVGGPPPEPRTIHPNPPLVTWIALLLTGASVFAADGVRRRQLGLIQAVADARRKARDEAEQQEREALSAGAPAPPGSTPGQSPA